MSKSVKRFLEYEYLNKSDCLNLLSCVSAIWDNIKEHSSNLDLIMDREVEYIMQKIKVYCLEVVYNINIDLDIVNMFIKESKEIITKLEEESFNILNNFNLQMC